MFRYAVALSLCLGLLMGCSQKESTVSKNPNKDSELSLPIKVGEFALNNPIEAGNVTLVPISINKPIETQDGNFITLAEAKKEGLVEITELGEEEVSALRVTNKGTRPLLLLGGDLLLGGKQDRIVARDVIVPPGKTMNVSVYCVEQSRWDGQSEHFEYKGVVVPEKVRQAAAHEGQEAVWGEVSAYNKENDGMVASQTIMGGLSTEKVQKTVNDNLPKVLNALKEQKNIVGFIYVSNGKVQSADLFGSPRILEAAKEGLLKGYLADSAGKPVDSTAKVDLNACRKFMQEVLKDREERAKKLADGKASEMRGQGLRGVELKAYGGSAPGSKDVSGFVHGNYAPEKKD